MLAVSHLGYHRHLVGGANHDGDLGGVKVVPLAFPEQFLPLIVPFIDHRSERFGLLLIVPKAPAASEASLLEVEIVKLLASLLVAQYCLLACHFAPRCASSSQVLT